MFDKVAIIMGGNSAEREVSLASGQCVLESLIKGGINAVAVDPEMTSLINLKKDGFTHVFNILHGRGGEDGTLQGLLEYLQLPYTGSGVLSSALTMDKLKTKQIWKAAELPITNYIVLGRNDPRDTKQIIESVGLPLIVKPIHEGSSIGMSKVYNEEMLIDALNNAFKYDNTILVETCLTGPEFTVSIVGDVVLQTIRIEVATDVHDYHAKYHSNATRYFCPGSNSKEEEEEFKNLALRAYRALDCKGWGRVDIMLDNKRKPYLLEVNTAPGMTSHSLVPMAAKEFGWSFDQLVYRILNLTDKH